MIAIAHRFLPGQDLRPALETLCRERGIGAACVVTCVGSLRRAAVRFAGAPVPSMLDGPLEIVSLTGTVSPDGAHLHLVVAGEHGQLRGGHLAPGTPVHTTAEVILGQLPELLFRRQLDARTGHRELLIERP